MHWNKKNVTNTKTEDFSSSTFSYVCETAYLYFRKRVSLKEENTHLSINWSIKTISLGSTFSSRDPQVVVTKTWVHPISFKAHILAL